ncbi:DUF1161 domain-containing protein [Piscinibacter sakaiensis]|uniref:DUF1161 domain-containing protein n=1 Tax=Piscinibacter sakaiensis TaxID=1547922 RepID=A0A0K8P767_PISS1|nr:DUF1161 domain-containing protein [Piscinibacter sakaiensis]GAP38462.1 hypothetical protein ISF6_4920 [Piscinibacter sakaiensis]
MAAAPAARAAPEAAGAGAAAADNCQEITAGIDARIRAAGVSNYTLTTIDLATPPAGRVVGQCGNGRRRIVYSSVGPGAGQRPGVVISTLPDAAAVPPAASAPTAAPPRPRDDGMLTECREGYYGPDCRLRKTPAPPRSP